MAAKKLSGNSYGSIQNNESMKLMKCMSRNNGESCRMEKNDETKLYGHNIVSHAEPKIFSRMNFECHRVSYGHEDNKKGVEVLGRAQVSSDFGTGQTARCTHYQRAPSHPLLEELHLRFS